MDSSYRIIISTSSLNIEDWTDLYGFIDSIFTNDTDEKKINALHCLKERCIEVWRASESNTDVYQLDGNELTDDILIRLNKHTCFSILYQKKQENDDTEEFTGFAPFVLFLRRFIDKDTRRSLVSIGIDTDGMVDQTKANSFRFKFSNFFILYQDVKPVLGYRTLYFYSKKNQKTFSLAGKGKDSKYEGDSSRRFLPLLQITEENYHSIFSTSRVNTSEKSNDYLYVNESLNKIKSEFKNRILKTDESRLDLIVNNKDSLFGQWLINGYFYSYEVDEIRNMSEDEIRGIIQTLQIYKNSIFELVQNIIFHGGKNGLFYCVFDKKENVSSYYLNKLPDLSNETCKVNRFLRVGIYDFHKTGIVDSFKEREKKATTEGAGEAYSDLSLIDFFDTESIKTIGITQLEMRYAASLGIKSFVRTVFKHNGYFSVESNEVIDGHNLKKRISSIWKDDRPGFLPESIISNNAAGTHYEIILPVIPTPSISVPTLQRDTFFNLNLTLHSLLDLYKPIKVVDLDWNLIESISNSKTKEQQITAIRHIGDEIITSAGGQANEIILNLNGKDFDHKLVFKILAYLQLKAKNGFRKIILINGKEDFVSDFCELINPLLNDSTADEVHVWSNNAAIILMSEKLHVQIICGETKGELYSLNQEFRKYYFNNFSENDNLRFNLTKHNSHTPTDNIPKDFILPYDILIESSDGTTPFETYALNVLKRRINSNDHGYLVNHENTYIGNKIIVRNYYEADRMFQNSFFAERFAFLIAKKICKLKRTFRKDLVLIGYQQYSEYLIKAIKRILADNSVHIALATANDETADDNNKSSDIDISFNFDIDGDGSELQERILKSPEQFQFATIVPIGATLSTNDKIVALFKLWHKLQDTQDRESTDIEFIYNHCVIIVRDSISPKPTTLEEEQQWKAIQLDRHLIETDFRNAKEIHYTIQTAKADNSTDSNWKKRLNKEVSFPQEWVEEEYVNLTENSSSNSQNLMGFPVVGHYDEDCHQEELIRLYQLRRDIFKGHFDIFNSHQKYFFDTESYVKKENSKRDSTFIYWVKGLKKHLQNPKTLSQNKLNILIAPNAETESDFICTVNDQIFEGNALIVYLDVKNWRNNIIHKLSFIKNMDKTNVSFHYIDHILLTGETYQRTKSYLYSIIGGLNPIRFDSIITIINRLPYTKGKEIENDVSHFFAFINLYYPTSRVDGRECELCKLERYYDDLSKKTVLDSCKQVIQKNVDKLIICKSKRELEQCRNKRDIQNINRNFLRLVITHELYYRISQIAWDRPNKSFDSTQKDIYEELDAIYCKLCNKEHPGHKDTESNINDCIDKWFKLEFTEGHRDQRYLLEYHDQKLQTDKMISFIKVISSPPLSKYIIIRQYAHSKLLSVLYDIINDSNENENNENDNIYDDLKIVKSILKSLSFLKSNALVRKDVIVKVWKFLGKAHKHLDKDLTNINNCIEDCAKLIHSIEDKQQVFLIAGNFIPKLENQIKEANDYLDYLEREKKHLKKLFTKDEIIKDFSRDFQFFIKNAIVEDDAKATFLGELLRNGTEMTSFDSIKISKTNLSLYIEDTNPKDKNNLFEYFQEKNVCLNEALRKEYINFLVWLFYDNTTILRKTLNNFFKELDKDNKLRSFFKDGDKLKDIESFKNNIGSKDEKDSIKSILYDKINSEYYYSSFKPYLNNGDRIDYVNKLIYVLYAKLKLEDLIVNKDKPRRIEADIKELLNIFSEIMGADAAFFILKKDRKSYPVAVFKKDNPVIEWNHENWFLEDFYTNQILSSNSLIYPIIPLFDIGNERIYGFGEQNNIFDAHSLNVFIMNHPDNESNPNVKIRASITFLYNKTNSLTSDETEFRIRIQEYGRLLLLLKNGIDRYLFEYLIKERVFDLWLDNYMKTREYEKVFSKSNHLFNAVYDEMDEFENLEINTLGLLYRTWYFLTDETIGFIFLNIYTNIKIDKLNADHCVSIAEKYVIDDDNFIGKTFNEKFVFLLSRLLDEHWNEEHETQKNMILINGQDIHDYPSIKEILIKEELFDESISMNKHLLRTFIAQCLHNSLGYNKHGHRNWGEIKRVEITITKSHITIEDSFISDISERSHNNLLQEIRRFRHKKRYIQALNWDKFSSTTLTSLQGVMNYMNQHNYPFHCEFGFNKNKNFFVTIKYQKKWKRKF